MSLANDNDGLSDLASGGLRQALRQLHSQPEPNSPSWWRDRSILTGAALGLVWNVIWYLHTSGAFQ